MSLIEEQCYLPQCTMTRAAVAAASVGSAEQPTLLLTPVRSASSPPSHVLQTTTMSRSSYSAVSSLCRSLFKMHNERACGVLPIAVYYVMATCLNVCTYMYSEM